MVKKLVMVTSTGAANVTSICSHKSYGCCDPLSALLRFARVLSNWCYIVVTCWGYLPEQHQHC